MKVLIVDPFETGHHLTYLYHISRSFLENSANIVVLGAFNNEFYNKFNSLKKIYPERLQFEKYIDEFGSYNNKTLKSYTSVVLSRWMQIKQKVLQYGDDFDFVFIPWLDSYIDGRIEKEFFDQIGFSWTGIYFQPYFLNPNINSIRKASFNDPAPLFKSVTCISIGVLTDCKQVTTHLLFNNKKLFIVPDFADMEMQLISKFDKEISIKSEGRYVVGVFGSLAKRKGLLPLFETIKKYRMYDKYFFILAGELIESSFTLSEKQHLFRFVKEHNETFFFHPRRISSEMHFNALMSKSDVIYAAYKNFFYSSNMLTKSANLGKPVIVTKNTYMGQLVNKYRLGLAIETNSRSIYEAIAQLETNSEQIVAKEKMKQFIDKQSIKELNNVIKSLLLK